MVGGVNMRNPLYRRIPRELKTDAGKYVVLFFFLIIMIGFTCGYMVGNGSMSASITANLDESNVENGHFILSAEAGGSALDTLSELNDVDLAKNPSAMTSSNMLDTLFGTMIGDADGDVIARIEEKADVKIEAEFYKDKTVTAGTHKGDDIRVYRNRKSVNLVECMKGRMPKKVSEITLDRLYAANNDISIGDTITIENKKYTVCGLTSFSDYSCLYKNNTDMMFDANHFSVSIVTDAEWNNLSTAGIKYCYAWRNNDQTLTDKEQQDKSEEIIKLLSSEGTLSDIVARPDSNAINFAKDDISGDRTIMQWFLYIVIVIIAFIFGITTRSTIENEAKTIGTLMASGYSRRELLRHYLLLPTAITVAAGIVGNILGYTYLKTLIVNIYYHSYSLGSYTTKWNITAFLQTTVVPVLIILVVNCVVIGGALRCEPLQFLRGDLHPQKKSWGAIRLPNWTFKGRFRMRVIVQNKSAYATLFVGIFMASILMMFGFGMKPMIDSFKDDIVNSQFAKYQYLLKTQYYVEDEAAEKYAYTSLENENGEEIGVYGIRENSRYFSGDLVEADGNADEIPVLASSSYMDKYGLKEGDKIALTDKYEGVNYTFILKETFEYPSTLCISMPLDTYNEVFDNDSGYYIGYMCDHKLDELNDKFIASIITRKDLTLTADQLNSSMGNMMSILQGFTVAMYILILYLLAKISIDRNGKSISLIKILGYTDAEAGEIYSHATGIVSIVSLIICTVLSYYVFRVIFYAMMQSYTGWITYCVPAKVFAEIIIIGIVSYFVVSRILLRRIRKIPMTDALKMNE